MNKIDQYKALADSLFTMAKTTPDPFVFEAMKAIDDLVTKLTIATEALEKYASCKQVLATPQQFMDQQIQGPNVPIIFGSDTKTAKEALKRIKDE